MGTILEDRTTHEHPPQLRSLTLLDRLALHSGLALIRWAERSDRKTRTVPSSRATLPARQAREALESRIAHRELTEARHRIGLVC